MDIKATSYQPDKGTNNNLSTNKVLAIMEILASSQEPMRLIDIATNLKYNTSTTLRFLNSLEQNGYVYKDTRTLRYQMTYKICNLAYQISSHSDLIKIASAPLRLLSHSLKECVCLAICQDYSVIFVSVADAPEQILKTTQRVGALAPMHCTGVGKILLSEFSPSDLDELIRAKGLEPFTANTITTKAALSQELELIRRRGYSYDNEEFEIGARCVAFPVRNHSGRIIAAMSVTGPSSRLTDAFIDSNFRLISDTVNSISYQLGYHASAGSAF